MKYMTKQWYQTMQDSGLGICLKGDDRALEFSEELFQSVWEEKLADWLGIRRRICKTAEYPFDEGAERQTFERNYRMSLERLQARTPAAILEMTADVRLLALDRCSGAVLEAFQEFREACSEQTDRTVRDYHAAFQAQGLDAPWVELFGFHDERIISWCEVGDDKIIDFGPAAEGCCPVEKIIFRNATILQQERPIDGAWWLYEEVYQVADGYEIHLLLDNGGLIELTIRCADVELVTSL